ncbi:hypothetical protein CAJCM15448_47960 [Candidozyma auris]|nr:hypothetical protein CAJCM15448_47960 [[Candida] auris]
MPAATPIKMTAEQKEAQIMNEIRKNNAKFEPRSLFGKILYPKCISIDSYLKRHFHKP